MTRTPIEERLRDQLTRLSEYAAAAPREQAPTVIVAHRSPRHRRKMITAVAAAVLVTTGAVAFVATRDDETTSRVNVVGSVADVLAPGALRILPKAPISGRIGPAAVWDGTEMLVWGGSTPQRVGGESVRADGAAYSPRNNTWRALPQAPIGGRAYASTVWTGAEMIVWGGSDNGRILGDGAAYNPTTNAWRAIAGAPIPPAMKSATVWTGREMIVVGGLNGGPEGAAYEPANDLWRKLPDAPGGITPPYPQAVWTGSQAIFLVDLTGQSPVLQTLVAYDPVSRRWTTLASTYPTRAPGWLAWTGSELLALGGPADHSGTFDFRAGLWSRNINPPPDPDALSNAPVWSGSQAIFWRGGDVGLAYEPATGSWRTYNAGGLPPRVDGAVVWADGLLIGWGGLVYNSDGSAAADDQGIVYRPGTASSPGTTTLLTAQPSTPTNSVATEDSAAEGSIRDVFLRWMNAQPHDTSGEWVEDYASIVESVRQGMAQHTSEALAKYSGRVESVSILDATHAAVRYSILFGGTPQYANQPGEAIKVDGVWKVSRETVCNLLTFGGITCPPRTVPTTAAGG